MKKYLKILSLSTSLILLFGISSCGKEKNRRSDEQSQNNNSDITISLNPKDGSVSGGDENCIHKWGDFKVEVAPKCEVEGKAVAYCQDCGATNTIILDPIDHEFTNYVSDHNATMLKDGTKTAHCNHEGCDATHTIKDEGSKLNPTDEVMLYSRGIKSLFENNYLFEIDNLVFDFKDLDISCNEAKFYLSVNEDKDLVGYGKLVLNLNGFGTNVDVSGTAILQDEELYLNYTSPEDDIPYTVSSLVPLSAIIVNDNESFMDYLNKTKSIINKISQEIDNLNNLKDKAYLNSAIILSAGFTNTFDKKVVGSDIIYNIDNNTLNTYNEQFYTLTIDKLIDHYSSVGFYDNVATILKSVLSLSVKDLINLSNANNFDLLENLDKFNNIISEISNGEVTKVEQLYHEYLDYPITDILHGDDSVILFEQLPEDFGLTKQDVEAKIDEIFDYGKNNTLYELIASLDGNVTAKEIHDEIEKGIDLFSKGSNISITTSLLGDVKTVIFEINNFSLDGLNVDGSISLIKDGQLQLDFDSIKNQVENDLANFKFSKGLIESLNIGLDEDLDKYSAVLNDNSDLVGIKRVYNYGWIVDKIDYSTDNSKVTTKSVRDVYETTYDLTEPYIISIRKDCEGYYYVEINAKTNTARKIQEKVEVKAYNDQTHEYDTDVTPPTINIRSTTYEDERYENFGFMYDKNNNKLLLDIKTKHYFVYDESGSQLASNCLESGHRHYVCDICNEQYDVYYEGEHHYIYEAAYDDPNNMVCTSGVTVHSECEYCHDETNKHYTYHKANEIEYIPLDNYGISGGFIFKQCVCKSYSDVEAKFTVSEYDYYYDEQTAESTYIYKIANGDNFAYRYSVSGDNQIIQFFNNFDKNTNSGTLIKTINTGLKVQINY